MRSASKNDLHVSCSVQYFSSFTEGVAAFTFVI